MSGARRRFLTSCAALCGIVWLCYGGSLENEFVFDDAIFAERDSRVQSISGAVRLFSEPLWSFADDPGTTGLHQYYRPLQQLPLVVANVGFGGDPFAAHLIDLLLHALNAILVLSLLLTLGVGPGAAALLSALFAAHPASSEVVLWVADSAGLGSAACTLGCVLLHARFRRSDVSLPGFARRGVARHGRLRPALALALAVGALSLSAAWFKESGALVPLFLLIYDALSGRRERGCLSHHAASLLGVGIYLACRYHALGGLLPGAGDLALGPAELILNAIALLPSYAMTLAWPFELNMYHDFEPVVGMTDTRVAAGLALAIGAVSLLLTTWRSRPVVAFGIAWTMIAVSPFLLVRWPEINVFAERYLSLPTIGVVAAIGGWLAMTKDTAQSNGRSLASRIMPAAAALVLLAVYVTTVRARVPDWKDEVTLYTRTLEQSPRAELIRNNLALRYLALDRPRDGIAIQRELVAMSPDFARAWHNLGLLYLADGDDSAAVGAFTRAAEIEPTYGPTWLNLGYAQSRNGHRAEATIAYFRAVAAAPTDTRAWYNLAVIAFEQGQPANALRAIDQVLTAAPEDRAARALREQIQAGERPPAPQAASAGSAGDTAGNDTSNRNTRGLAERGRKLAEAGETGKAIAVLNAAAWLDEGSDLPHRYLANVYYLSGERERALVHQRAAVERAPDNPLNQRNLRALEKQTEADPK